MMEKTSLCSEGEQPESLLDDLQKGHEVKEIAGWESGCSGLSRSFQSPNSPMKGELKEIMGIEAEPVLVRIFRWEKAMPQYVVGHGERIKEIEELMSKHPGLYLTGSAYHGIGISDTVREAEVAAKKVLRYLEVGIPA